GGSGGVRVVATVVVMAALAALSPASGQQRKPTWAETKCIRYTAAWIALEKQRGLTGLGVEFLARHKQFIDGGCRSSTHVCPRTNAELEVADMMAIAALNGGMASTFPPFSCKQ
ncbi:MAG: hypothetical protein ACRCUE_04710, partial [Bosea sp. (in: a-proteobacteria)]